MKPAVPEVKNKLWVHNPIDAFVAENSGNEAIKPFVDGLAETKNGAVVRKEFGYAHIPQRHAARFNTYCREYLNPFLNFHRPCLFATELPDPKKPGRIRRVYRATSAMTPLDKLTSLPDAAKHLRQGIEVAPESPALLGQMAELQFRRGNFMSARAFFQRRDSLGAVTPELLDLAVRIEQGAGDAAAAGRYRQRLQQQFPDFTPSDNQGSLQP